MTGFILLQALVGGLTMGSIYGLVAISINVMYRPSHMFNFAQGNLVFLGAIASFILVEGFRLPWPLAIVAVLAVGALAGGIEELVAIRPLLDRIGSSTWILTTLAVGLIVESVIGRFVGEVPTIVRPMWPLSVIPFHVGPVLIQTYQIAVFLIAWGLVASLDIAYATRHGRAALALGEDRIAALLRGIPAGRVILTSWILGGSLAMLTGLLAAPVTYASVGLSGTMLIKGFEAAAVGGLGANRPALLGGLLIGATESVSAITLNPGFRDAATFAVLILVMSFRPTGLFSAPAIRGV